MTTGGATYEVTPSVVKVKCKFMLLGSGFNYRLNMAEETSNLQADPEQTSIQNDKEPESRYASEIHNADSLYYCCNMSALACTVMLAILTIIGIVGINVSLPVYTSTILKGGSGPIFVLIWNSLGLAVVYCMANLINYIRGRIQNDNNVTLLPTMYGRYAMIGGVLHSLNLWLVYFASLPNRTPPYLQAVLYTSTIPYCIIIRKITLKRGKFKTSHYLVLVGNGFAKLHARINCFIIQSSMYKPKTKKWSRLH